MQLYFITDVKLHSNDACTLWNVLRLGKIEHTFAFIHDSHKQSRII